MKLPEHETKYYNNFIRLIAVFPIDTQITIHFYISSVTTWLNIASHWFPISQKLPH